MKSGLFQSFQHMFARLRRAELPSEPLGVEEWRQTLNNGAFALDIPVSTRYGVDCSEERMCLELREASGVAGQGAVKCLDRLVVAVQEIIRHTDVHSCPSVGAVEA